MQTPPDIISVIITVYNGGKWIDRCFDSILKQSVIRNDGIDGSSGDSIKLEICVFDDCSCDDTGELCTQWRSRFEQQGIGFLYKRNRGSAPIGVGYGRNEAIKESSGQYFCFQDIDDEMLPERIEKQYKLARRHHDAIIGSRFLRSPPNSTCRFSNWANELLSEKLTLQIYTSNGPTIIMPTWFCHRAVYDRIDEGFCESGQGTPEDLIFFYKHLELGGSIIRCDDYLLLYRYHPEATTFTVKEETIWSLRLEYLLKHTLLGKPPWSEGFMIWNAGKQGRRFFRNLPQAVKNKVLAFCDIDKNKVGKTYQPYDVAAHRFTHSIPIIHFSEAKPPLVICMKLNLTKGEFEKNLKSLNFREGTDYILFT